MYNLATMLEELEDKLDPKKKACLSDIASAAAGVISLTKMAQQNKSTGLILSSDSEFDRDFGVFDEDDIQAILKAMKYTIDFVLFGVRVIRTCRNAMLRLSLAASIHCRSVARD